MSANSYILIKWNLKKGLETQVIKKKKSVDNSIDMKNPNPILYLIPSVNNLHSYPNQKKQVWCSSSTAASPTFPSQGYSVLCELTQWVPLIPFFTTPER